MDRPTIDVLVSTYNEEAYIGRCLDHVMGQDYDPERVTAWLIDGGSTDGTVAIAEEYARRDPRLKIITVEERLNLPASLNIGIKRATADLVAKIDAHGWPERDFLSRAVDAFEAAGPDVACVGGRPEQLGETPFGQALALARTSKFGVGGSGYAGEAQREDTDTVQCGVYRRQPLVAVGGFDADMNYGEDDELNWRLIGAGHRILLDTRIRFHYITRPSWTGAYRQYRNYGRARVRVVAAHPNYLKPYHLAPAAFVAGMGGLVAAAPFSRPARWGLGVAAGAYVATALGEGLRARGNGNGNGAGEGDALRVASAFPALHVGYGIGMLRGLPHWAGWRREYRSGSRPGLLS